MGSLKALVPHAVRRGISAQLAKVQASRLERNLAALSSGSETIEAGPWLGEVGFELLYWVPFLRWFAERFHVAPERFLIVSRGGTAAWYRPFAGRYADVFEQVSPEMFREQHDLRVRELGEQN